jgi:hypothetical protein
VLPEAFSYRSEFHIKQASSISAMNGTAALWRHTQLLFAIDVVSAMDAPRWHEEFFNEHRPLPA